MAARTARIASASSASSLARLASFSVTALLVTGCASMIAGSPAWFEGQKPDVEVLAKEDLACPDKPITYTAPTGDDYREVQAAGCGKKALYKLVGVGPVKSWSKSGEVTPL